VSQENVLEFGRGDLISLVFDDVLVPAHDLQVAARVDYREVAGVQPALLVWHRDGLRCV
jgi:hypothetical protein